MSCVCCCAGRPVCEYIYCTMNVCKCCKCSVCIFSTYSSVSMVGVWNGKYGRILLYFAFLQKLRGFESVVERDRSTLYDWYRGHACICTAWHVCGILCTVVCYCKLSAAVPLVILSSQ